MTTNAFWADAAFRSTKARWGTPPEFVKAVENRYNIRFVLDAAAEENWKMAPLFIGPDNPDIRLRNVLAIEWSYVRSILPTGTVRPAVWMNPPYTRHYTGKFVSACLDASRALALPVFALIFARTETKFWQDIIFKHASQIDFLRGRMIFLDPDTRKPKLDKHGRIQSAPAPSALVCFNSFDVGRIRACPWAWREDRNNEEDEEEEG